MEDQLKQLTQQLAQLTHQLEQKDEMIAMMKTKTRDYVQNMKEEHSAATQKLEAAFGSVSEVNKPVH